MKRGGGEGGREAESRGLFPAEGEGMVGRHTQEREREMPQT